MVLFTAQWSNVFKLLKRCWTHRSRHDWAELRQSTTRQRPTTRRQTTWRWARRRRRSQGSTTEQVERPVSLTELNSASELYFTNHGVRIAQAYSLKLGGKPLPTTADTGARIRLKYASNGTSKGSSSLSQDSRFKHRALILILILIIRVKAPRRSISKCRQAKNNTKIPLILPLDNKNQQQNTFFKFIRTLRKFSSLVHPA